MTVYHRSTAIRIACLVMATGLAACSSIDNFLSGDKVDYRSGGKTREKGLDVPPDLTQLSREARFQQQGGTVSAAQFQAGTGGGAATAAAPAASGVMPAVIGDLRIEREGNQRWLAVPMPPEQLWPQLQSFWTERGFKLVIDQADVGVMETDWAEDRSKRPKDPIRNALGKIIDSLYSSGDRDKFRTRVERTATGSEVYVSYRGLMEVYSGAQKETTVWQPVPADPQLEAEMLQRLMLRLGAKDEQAKTAVAPSASAAVPPARARAVSGQNVAALQVDDGFDRAWRRVGLALDRSGFTVEDRDRASGLYFVRYVDPAQAGSEEPGFLSKLLNFGRKKEDAGAPTRYRVLVKGEGERSTVTVLNAQGTADNGAVAQRIVSLLLEDLK